jgi:hypothetical protein
MNQRGGPRWPSAAAAAAEAPGSLGRQRRRTLARDAEEEEEGKDGALGLSILGSRPATADRHARPPSSALATDVRNADVDAAGGRRPTSAVAARGLRQPSSARSRSALAPGGRPTGPGRGQPGPRSSAAGSAQGQEVQRAPRAATYRPVSAKASYVDESLFGNPGAAENKPAPSAWAAPWHDVPAPRPPKVALPESDRTSWLAPNNLRSARAVDPRKYTPTDPWGSTNAMSREPPRRATKKDRPSDPWRSDGFLAPPALKAAVAGAPKATIDLTFQGKNGQR